MIDQDALKAVIHDEDSFKKVLDARTREVRDTLDVMYSNVSAQIAMFGDERAEWYRKTTRFAKLLKLRLDQADRAINEKYSREWKNVLDCLLNDLHEAGFGDEELPDKDDLDAVEEWIETIDFGVDSE